MHDSFPDRPDLVRKIYEDIRPLYRDDGHYWLQSASYEIEYGSDIDVAENHLKQAEALMPHSDQVQTAMAHLLMKKAASAGTSAIAQELKDEGLQILRAQMADTASVTLHPLHIFGSQMITYIRRWIRLDERSDQFRAVHEELRRAVPDHLRGHPDLRRLLEDLKRAELEPIVKR
jgi:hypothetical protein